MAAGSVAPDAKLPVTAVVVSCNEAHLLGRCLDSIGFVDDVLVVDLESTDTTAEVAAAHGCRYLRHSRLPIVEQVHVAVADRARHDWILLVDPDQWLDGELGGEIVAGFPAWDADPEIGIVSVPMLYYFGRRALGGTFWGGVHEWYLLLRRESVELTGRVHGGVVCRPARRVHFLPHGGGNVLHHAWARGWRDLVARHRRYLGREGEARFAAGERFSWRAFLGEGPRRFRESFLARRGWRDGALGFALSLFWAWYCSAALLSLRARERRG